MTKVTFFSAKPYDRQYFEKHNDDYGYELEFFETHLGPHIVYGIGQTDAVCAFVNDKLHREVLQVLKEKGVKIVALRCAGFNNVDLEAARELGIQIARVPAYSPEAVAEHTMAMVLTLNRKTHKAYNRVREQNFALQGLLGFNLHGKAAGIIGLGKIGLAYARIAKGFGMRVMAFDPSPSEEAMEMGIELVSLEELYREADVISLHAPLNDHTYHIVNQNSIHLMKDGVTIINTGRGALIDTDAVIEALKKKKVGALGLDVYEQEEKLFFRDLSMQIIDDDTIMRLMSFPNVLITSHQAFFTHEALEEIATTTLDNIRENLAGRPRNLITQ